MLRLGYPNENLTLEKQGIKYSGTPEISEIKEMERARKGSGIKYLKDLFSQNLDVLLEIIKWNVSAQIFLYRMPEDLAPLIGATEFLPPGQKTNSRALIYEFGPRLLEKMKKIGHLARKEGIRLTFHPDLRVVLNSPNKYILMKSARDLYAHALIMDKMGLDDNSILVLHGGGVYGNKEAARERWVSNFNKMPANVKRRVVLENDEDNYSIDDVLWMAARARPKIPVLLDLFHFSCYRARGPDKQMGLADAIDRAIKSWGKTKDKRRAKMHISEQMPGGKPGMHSDYVHKVPRELLAAIKAGAEVDLMVEARKRELAVKFLRKELGIGPA